MLQNGVMTNAASKVPLLENLDEMKDQHNLRNKIKQNLYQVFHNAL